MPSFGGTVTAETALNGAASAVGSAATVAHSDHTHGAPAMPSANQLAAPTASWSNASFNITNLADPVNPQDASTKNYVDNAIAGLSWKAPCRAATTANITLSGTQTVDGIALVAGDRCLVKNQTTASGNGIYVVAAGAWARATDSSTGAQVLNESTYVESGTTQSDTAWVCTTDPPITIGSTSLTYVQFAGGGTYTAGNGLTLTGNVFAVGAGNGIQSVAGSINVDPAVVARKYSQALAGTASPEVITHNLNTQDITVSVHASSSPFSMIQCDWQATSVNTVSILYSPNIGAGYRVTVIG
jgi:hypothetical protein